jgi:hypothetical protein
MRANADEALQAALTAEASARATADNDEAITRLNADNTEASIRLTADEALQDQIDGINGELDEIPDIYAPINSPHFTGLPTTPEPDYTVPEQVADVRGILQLRDMLILTVYRGA